MLAKGTLAGGVCTYKVALAANTAYALVLDDSGDNDHEVAGTLGPLSVMTWANGKTNGVCMDENKVLDTVTTLAAATTGLTLTVAKDAANGDKFKYVGGSTPSLTFKWAFDSGLHPSNEKAEGKKPFSVKKPWTLNAVLV